MGRGFINFEKIIYEAWEAYDDDRKLSSILDISVHVSTNYVYQIKLDDGENLVAKISYFGKFEYFKEDHILINTLANNLTGKFANILSRSIMKGNEVFIHRHIDDVIDAWVVFYNPIIINKRLPKILKPNMIEKLGSEMAQFHRACSKVKKTLPTWSKSMKSDLDHLLEIVNSDFGQYEHRGKIEIIKEQIEKFETACKALEISELNNIPVFVDWNIGNFSVNENFELFSRWDYDWFRIGPRVLDFYFISRVCNKLGDRTAFTYEINTLNDDNFLIFLKAYHQEFPLTEKEILFLKEAYRFFLLKYVIMDGRYFFHEIYASKLQKDAYTLHFPSIENFSCEKLLSIIS